MEILAKAGSREGDEEHKNDSVSHHFSCPWKEAVLAVVVIVISVLQLYWFQFREFGISSLLDNVLIFLKDNFVLVPFRS